MTKATEFAIGDHDLPLKANAARDWSLYLFVTRFASRGIAVAFI